MTILAHRDGRVNCHAEIPLSIPADSVWGQLRDFVRYASHDYFHADIRIQGGVPRQGARLRMSHRLAFFRIERVGRVLRWREGEGFAISDLSTRGFRAGFPHVFILRIEPTGPASSLLHLCVRGCWTATWVPLIARKIWLAWVFGYVVSRTRNELLAYQAARVTLMQASSPALARRTEGGRSRGESAI